MAFNDLGFGEHLFSAKCHKALACFARQACICLYAFVAKCLILDVLRRAFGWRPGEVAR